MARSRRKLSRKELVQQDEITSHLEEAVEYVVDHPRPFLGGVALVVVVAVVAMGWTLYASGRREDAQAALGSVIRAYNDTFTYESDAARYAATLTEAERVEGAYGGMSAGRIARYYAALSHLGLEEFEEADRMFGELAASGDPAMRPLARFGLGQSLKEQGQFDQAIGVYAELLESGEYAPPALLFELAQLQELAGRPVEARTYYESLLSDHPESAYQPEAEKAIKRLDTTGSGAD